MAKFSASVHSRLADVSSRLADVSAAGDSRMDRLSTILDSIAVVVNEQKSQSTATISAARSATADEDEHRARLFRTQQDVLPWVKDLCIVDRAVSGRAKPEALYHLADPKTSYGALVPPKSIPSDPEASAALFVDFFKSRPDDFDWAWRNYSACCTGYAGRSDAVIVQRAMAAHREILRGLAWAYPRDSVLLYHHRVQERRGWTWRWDLRPSARSIRRFCQIYGRASCLISTDQRSHGSGMDSAT